MITHTQSSNFVLRSIDILNDDISHYLEWMRNQAQNPFIQGISSSITKDDLTTYISEKNSKSDCILFGIFEKVSNTHIGNVKLEPIILNKSATVGILIGDLNYRGKGVGFEVISELISYSKEVLKLKELNLGVNIRNTQAYNLYTKLGFLDISDGLDQDDSRQMKLIFPE